MSVHTADGSVNNITGTSRVYPDEELLGEIFEWLHNLTHVFKEKSREIEKNTGLSRNLVMAMKVISTPHSSSVSGLAKRMHINSVTMVRILDRLEKLELITRIRSTKDRRVVEIRVTEKAGDLELMLNNMTHDILMSCFGAGDTSELMEKLATLQNLASRLDAGSVDFSKNMIVGTLKEKY